MTIRASRVVMPFSKVQLRMYSRDPCGGQSKLRRRGTEKRWLWWSAGTMAHEETFGIRMVDRCSSMMIYARVASFARGLYTIGGRQSCCSSLKGAEGRSIENCVGDERLPLSCFKRYL